jgi:DNA-binding transcriptional LysR family regulator
MDVDLRKLRYFMAVAEHRNFSRAAEELHIAQPVLSRQIRALEGELGAELFVRDSRGTRLTPAGTQLALDAEPLLADAEALRRRVARAARGTGTFIIAFMPGLIVTEPARALARAHPELVVEVLRTGWDSQTAVLHDGRADVSYVRLPVDRHGLALRPLFTEPRVAVLPGDHRLAGKETVGITDLADEHLLQHPDAVPEWREVATEMRNLRRSAPPRTSHTVEEKLEHVATGRGIVILHETVATYYRRPDIAYVHLTDIPPAEIALAWSSSRRSPLIAEFVGIADGAGT